MPLIQAMNELVPKYISWCTPSIPNNIAQVYNVYKDDISVSFHTLGSFLSNTGYFNKAHILAAQAYDADHTFFSVNGSTGSNFIVLYTLKSCVKGRPRILSTRNIHKSVLHACEVFEIDLDFLPANYDNHWYVYQPPYVDQVKEALAKADHRYDAVLLTNPTYGGLTCKLKEIVELVHAYDPKTWVFVDEAWGSHLHFTENLPYSSMEAGADIAVQSTHKQGGALQQSGMIHVKGDRVNVKKLHKCHQYLTTTSPSYHLLASLDAARWYLQKNGKQHLDEMIELANDFRERVNEMPGLSTFGREYCDGIDCALDMDLTKVQIRSVESGYRGFDIDHILESEMNIITEKSDAYTIMFITTFEIHKKDMLATASSLSELISSDKYERHWDIDKLSEITVQFPHTLDKVMEFPDAIDAIEEGRIKTVEFSELEGRICAENITLYPPGIPLIIAGERFTKDVLLYLDKTRKGLTEIIAHDPKLNTVDVID
jgi:arginine/lysine/ornithine decarboxylase